MEMQPMTPTKGDSGRQPYQAPILVHVGAPRAQGGKTQSIVDDETLSCSLS